MIIILCRNVYHVEFRTLWFKIIVPLNYILHEYKCYKAVCILLEIIEIGDEIHDMKF